MTTIQNKFVHTLFIVSIYWISSFASAYADTRVPGTIADGTVWTKDKSPYVVTSSTELPAGATLTVESGVVVKLEDASIEVFGTVRANGTETEPITFTSLKDDTAAGDTNSDGSDSVPTFGDWHGINFHYGGSGSFDYIRVLYGWIDPSNSTSTFNHALFSDAEFSIANGNTTVQHSVFENAHGLGIEVRDNAYVTIEDTVIDNAKRNALTISGGDVSLSNSSIKNTKQGELGNAVLMSANSSLTMDSTTLDGGTVGIKMLGPNTLQVSNSVIKNFTDTGILDTIGPVLAIATPNISFASIPIHTAASEYDGSNISVVHTEITANGAGVFARDKSTVAVHDSAIYENQYGADGGNFENNWWGDISGPYEQTSNPSGKGNEVSDITLYRPWLTANPLIEEQPTCCSSVAFLPGIEASRLYSALDGGEKLWEPFSNAEAKQLYLNPDGTSIDSTIYTKDIVDRFKAFDVSGPVIYQSFMSAMDTMVSDGTIKAWKPLPYDWRQAVTDVVDSVQLQSGVLNMVNEIELLAAGSNTGKVTIIAHSNGGLVAKALLMKLQAEGKANMVDKIIFVAVPQLGTPDAVSALLHGMKLGGGLILNRSTSRELAENMPGVYGLLPSKQYFASVTDPIVVFDETTKDISNLSSVYGSSITTFEKLQDFLRGTDGRIKPAVDKVNDPNILNELLLDNSEQLHNLLDKWQPPQDVEVVQIAGWGEETLEGITYSTKYPCGKLIKVGACKPYMDESPILTVEGDKTVVYPSAIYSSANPYFFNIQKYNQEEHAKINHKNILEASSVIDFVRNLIQGENSDVQYITTTKPSPSDGGKRIHVSIHSPASIDLYDTEGNHTGVVTSPSSDFVLYEENIPNSYYMEFGEGKYAGFTDEEGGEIKIQGTGTGTFTLNIEHLIGDTISEIETFADVPVTPSTMAEVNLSDSGTNVLMLDSDGDGKTDRTIQSNNNNSNENIDPIQFLQNLKITIRSLHLPKAVEKLILKKIDSTIKFLSKHKESKFSQHVRQLMQKMKDKEWDKPMNLPSKQKLEMLENIKKILDTIR